MNTQELTEYAESFKRQVKGYGTGATAVAVLKTTGRILKAKLNTKGSGYKVNDVLSVSGGATLKVGAVNHSGAVISFIVTNKGSTVSAGNGVETTVAPSGGTGCKLDITIQKQIDSITITDPGTNYIKAFVKISGSVATGTIDDGSLTEINVISSEWYSSPPQVVIESTAVSSTNDMVDLLVFIDSERTFKRILTVLRSILSTEVFTPEITEILKNTENDIVQGMM